MPMATAAVSYTCTEEEFESSVCLSRASFNAFLLAPFYTAYCVQFIGLACIVRICIIILCVMWT